MTGGRFSEVVVSTGLTVFQKRDMLLYFANNYHLVSAYFYDGYDLLITNK
jgi:hypothetical protein